MNSALDQKNRSGVEFPGQTQTPRENPLVLVVEDHEDTRLLLRIVMEMRGCRVIEAADGEEGVRLATRTNPALILMDTDLPHVDGFSATRQIRSFAPLRDVPIIFISGHAQPEHRTTALATGGTEYFVKPIALGELEQAVERQLKNNISRGIGAQEVNETNRH